VWYLDWGSGVGGYVANLEARLGDDDEEGLPKHEGWKASAWSIALAGLLNSFSATGDWFAFKPTPRLVPQPSSLHPIDAPPARY
jgi:hypothetical protein